MAERSWMVGSLPDCDIRVENTAVSGRHCRLTQRGESFLLEDLGSTNGTFVAGERVNGPQIVRRGDPVTLGRNTPLPWPPLVRTITIGRLPDNDIVIPLDMISGQHARLEQEGDTVYLIDLGSSNGTAINDPINKITRAAVQPTDAVFFGTHRVAAWELLKALPKYIERHATALEAGASAELERELASADVRADRKRLAESLPWEKFGSRSSWSWGIGLSALCAIVILGAPWILGRGHQRADDASKRSDAAERSHVPPADTQSDDTKHDAKSIERPPSNSPAPTPSIATPSLPPAPTESVVRRSEKAVVLIGVRIGKELAIHTASAWACRQDAVICPTSTLEMLEKELKEFKGLDASLVVCTPKKTLAILEHKAGQGSAEGFSVARLEAPLDNACSIAPNDARLEPQQELAALAAHVGKKDDPKSIQRRFEALRIDHIERSDIIPTMLHCRVEKTAGGLLGAPVFDGSGLVVGCVGPSADGVDVVPVSRLSSLLMGNP